jgi:hypothetical protein
MSLRIVDMDESEETFDADDNPTGVRVVLEHGWEYLQQAAALLTVVDTEKAEKLRHILDHELVPESPARLRILHPQVTSIVDFLNGIETDIQVVTDADWRVRPRNLPVVEKKAPYLLYSFKDENGKTIHTLENVVSVVLTLRSFLSHAVAQGSDIEVD